MKLRNLEILDTTLRDGSYVIAFQFTASEQYRKGFKCVPDDIYSAFTQEERDSYGRIANELNFLKRGDSICAVLRKPG